LDNVEGGEDVMITRHGRPVAHLSAIAHRSNVSGRRRTSGRGGRVGAAPAPRCCARPATRPFDGLFRHQLPGTSAA
jgi:antitoxin (DNA-binding transcriptional repressor) of toxin-antitoxin stability system